MLEFRFTDTEGGEVWIYKPLISWNGWHVRVGNDISWAIMQNGDGSWDRQSVNMPLDDFEGIVWAIEYYLFQALNKM
ncbi:hypothetical protein DF947_10795 [Pedobacter paludis]|uniref:Uncharacterized protein n=1 Tax=Pedobacter paludis TaxID=2203212 RepID=A0A317F2H6_9SPHI|nr:hypothetical protein DF947_10795 [Pedobacter paludis]